MNSTAAAAAAADDNDNDEYADASWQYAQHDRIVRFIGIALIRDVITVMLGTGGKNPLGSLRCWTFDG